jgi:ribonuclease PH
MRPDGRADNEMRSVTMEVGYQEYAEGSVLVSLGQTKVLCAATVEEALPTWRENRSEG